MQLSKLAVVATALILQIPIAVAGETNASSQNLDNRVLMLIEDAGGSDGIGAFTMPKAGQLNKLPQHKELNEITTAKVNLGKFLFHDTSFALSGKSGDLMARTWSCATCHHSAAGFKAGIRQGIGEGGIRFGRTGAKRIMADGFEASADADALNAPFLPDIQPIASPTVLNSAWQDVMLWNGQFGNRRDGINADIPNEILATAGTPKEANLTGMSGVEVQALAGSGVHRLEFTEGSPLQSNERYQKLWKKAFGNKQVTTERAAKAIAAYERTIVANRAPFQRWLRGDQNAMTRKQLRGAELFFGDAGCVECHRGPALSSEVSATADEVFFAIGFPDLDVIPDGVHGNIDEATKKGRGGFTGSELDNYQFKIPQLYNLADTQVLGHGGSFRTIREVIEYKNNAQPAVSEDSHPGISLALDERFKPLGLTESEIEQLTAFIKRGLYDPSLHRYEPKNLPGDGCIVVDALTIHDDGRCPN